MTIFPILVNVSSISSFNVGLVAEKGREELEVRVAVERETGNGGDAFRA
jgi:hypothetical protein